MLSIRREAHIDMPAGVVYSYSQGEHEKIKKLQACTLATVKPTILTNSHIGVDFAALSNPCIKAE